MAKTKSFLRREEYARLSKLRIDGKILDVGGSKNSGYHDLVEGDHSYIVGNIDASYGIDILFNAEEPWPFADDSFDGVLFMNLLEHLRENRVAIRESFRVLKKGGTLAGVVPFLFNVHASPHDYYRYTRAALEYLLQEAGYTRIQIEELGTGAFSVVYHCLIGFVRWHWLASLLIPVFGGLDRLLSKIKPNNMMGPVYFPLGYYFEAHKS